MAQKRCKQMLKRFYHGASKYIYKKVISLADLRMSLKLNSSPSYGYSKMNNKSFSSKEHFQANVTCFFSFFQESAMWPLYSWSNVVLDHLFAGGASSHSSVRTTEFLSTQNISNWWDIHRITLIWHRMTFSCSSTSRTNCVINDFRRLKRQFTPL